MGPKVKKLALLSLLYWLVLDVLLKIAQHTKRRPKLVNFGVSRVEKTRAHAASKLIS